MIYVSMILWLYLCGFNTFKFAYKYKLEKNKGNLIISIVSLLTCIFVFTQYIIATIIATI